MANRFHIHLPPTAPYPHLEPAERFYGMVLDLLLRRSALHKSIAGRRHRRKQGTRGIFSKAWPR